MENQPTPEVTVEEALTQELTNTKAALDKAQADLADRDVALTKALSDAETAKANLVKSAGELQAAEQVIEGQASTISDLQATIDRLQKNPSAVPTFTHNKITYEVHAPSFQYKKETYTREQLLNDKMLQAELIEKKVGFITPKPL